MAVYSFPNITPDTLEFGIKYNTQVSTTSLSGITQTVELPGARWAGSMLFRDMTSTESAELKGFLLKLRGSSGRFFMGDLSQPSTINDIAPSAITIETGSTAREIVVTPAAGVFSIGDYIQIGNDDSRELKMIIGVTGTTTQNLLVEPLIKRTDYVGLSIYHNNTKGVFLLNSDDQAKWSVRSKAKLSDISLSFVEA